MQFKALRAFTSTTLGEVEAGQLIDAPDALAERMIAAGYLDRYETKVVRPHPMTPAEPVSALQAGQASTGETLKPSAPGVRKRRTEKSLS